MYDRPLTVLMLACRACVAIARRDPGYIETVARDEFARGCRADEDEPVVMSVLAPATHSD